MPGQPSHPATFNSSRCFLRLLYGCLPKGFIVQSSSLNPREGRVFGNERVNHLDHLGVSPIDMSFDKLAKQVRQILS